MAQKVGLNVKFAGTQVLSPAEKFMSCTIGRRDIEDKGCYCLVAIPVKYHRSAGSTLAPIGLDVLHPCSGHKLML